MAVHRDGPLTFTIQKHAARRLHYDFRLEIDGVLVSWPIPRGPAYSSGERRLAIQTEDHPYEYGTFEGVIPSPQYGGGQVIVWDAGTYTVIDKTAPIDFHARARAESLARDGLEAGHLSVFLNGRKLKGGWTLLRTSGEGVKSQWLCLKRRDGLERPGVDITREDRSVLSGLSIEDLEAGLLPAWRASQLAPSAEHVAGARQRRLPAPRELDSRAGALAILDHGRVTFPAREQSMDATLARLLASQPVTQAVLLGEMLTDPTARFRPLDLLYLDGFDLRSAAPADRRQLLDAVLAPLHGVELGSA